MILAVAATEIEMEPFLSLMRDRRDYLSCVTGIGPVETAVRLMSFLQQNSINEKINAVINFGIGGGYQTQQEGSIISLLDVCLAQYEILGDFGICFDNHIEMFSDELEVNIVFQLDSQLFAKGKDILLKNRIKYHSGNFITVNGVSGTGKRGHILFKKFSGICENMEGAAIARVCEEISLPLLELRCVSNMVENRDVSRWKVKDACEKAAFAASLIAKQL